MTTPDYKILHDAEAGRFAIKVDGQQGYVEYEQEDGVMAINHTIVPPAIGGRGIAGALVQAALDHARATSLKVAPHCSYADTWMRKHPEYEDLRC